MEESARVLSMLDPPVTCRSINNWDYEKEVDMDDKREQSQTISDEDLERLTEEDTEGHAARRATQPGSPTDDTVQTDPADDSAGHPR